MLNGKSARRWALLLTPMLWLLWSFSLQSMTLVSEPEFEPWSVSSNDPILLTAKPAAKAASLFPRSLENPFLFSIRLFQRAISPADGAVCNFRPTCSQYAYQAIKQHGLFLGLGLGTERILRDHHQTDLYQTRINHQLLLLIDPLQDNIFWQRDQ